MDKRIESIIKNRLLASAIHSSVASALKCPFVHLVEGKSVWDIFKYSLDAAIRDIEEHPRGKLFRRLIEYGPLTPEKPETLICHDEKNLSDPECGVSVEFIYSHMVNRFKGELSELLALEPCIKLIQQLRHKGYLPACIQLYWGETIQERSRLGISGHEGRVRWGNFAKGADGLLIEQAPGTKSKSHSELKIKGVIEVKSMAQSTKKVADQINKHITRLNGGVRLREVEWTSVNLNYAPMKITKKAEPRFIRVMVVPSTWTLSRAWRSVKTERGRRIEFPAPPDPPRPTQFVELEPDFWKITVAWSQESLNQAAYEMTFWYMSQVGRHVFSKKKLPKGWEYMTPEKAGYNAIKMMLYYIPLRYISERHKRLATRLYNVYCFGYPLGADSNEMLWPEDFTDKNLKRISSQLSPG